ncbi:protein FAR1-RELATED SEQUENCE 6-like [Carya illinoinensis]|uniref:protein FAR1-RELATED SEQUENCE 6-like n=1 Tax=Carya illinoinensis TaxID=32201 RepID=UPI001C71CC3E|nr:protein FAR1-RELATED SEQUENCE 6-like [Carya illinoinensis]
MGEEETSRPSMPSTSTQGYHLPYMMPTYPNPYPYTWGSQHLAMPPFGPTVPYPLSTNPEELRLGEDTTQHSSMPHDVPTMPFSVESEKNVGETSPDKSLSPNVEDQFEVSDEDNKVEPPKAGMKFGSNKEVLSYYKRYAKQEGFGVIIRRTKRDIDGHARYVTIACARGGRYYPCHSNLSKSRPTTKTDCKAKVNARLVKGEWVVTSVELVHNHSTISPKKARFFRSHKNLDEYSQRILDLNDRAGIRIHKNFNALVTDAGGYENLDFQEKDCKNFIDRARHLRMGKGGGEALNEYFKRMRKMNDGFVSVMDVDDEFKVRNVFWADARSRAAYEYFGDVITFDTIYLTNRYGMPFAPFVGVNHHGQSILLGAGLISSEDTSTFVWLFEAWLECMNGRAPHAIITDQDRAMKNAIAIVFPNTRHRYCLWHIMRKLPEKLGSHSAYHELKTAIQNAVYDTQSCKEFDEKWGQLMNNYALTDNAWLQGLYTERSYWVPVYLKGVFWAGMSTTQRSESMNAFFDGFVHSGTTLKEFVDQFDNALRKKVETETTADFHSCNQTIPCVFSFKIERQFQSCYTNAKFKEVQAEVIGMLLCNPSLVSTQGSISTFNVFEEISTPAGQSKIMKYVVYLNKEESEVKCTCALFEMKGIICRHSFKVCQMKYIHALPDKYLLDRWRKDTKRRYTLVKSSYDDCRLNPDARRYEEVVKRCIRFATRVSRNEEHVNAFFQFLDDFELKLVGVEPVTCSTKDQENVDANRGKKILSPHVVRGTGRPPTRRKVPMVEKAAGKRRKKHVLGFGSSLVFP